MKIKFNKFKQYHLKRRIVWSSKKDHPAENYQWLFRIYTGWNNWVLDLTKGL